MMIAYKYKRRRNHEKSPMFNFTSFRKFGGLESLLNPTVYLLYYPNPHLCVTSPTYAESLSIRVFQSEH